MRAKLFSESLQGLCRICSALAGAVLLSLVTALCTWAHVPAERDGGLLQLTSGGHILGFDGSSMYVASADHMLRMDFVGGRSVAPVAEDVAEQSDEHPSGRVQPLGRVSYREIWEGVSVIYERSKGGVVKSTYTISAGAPEKAVEQIRLLYNRPVQTDEQGNLVIGFKTGTMIEGAPVAWQEISGHKRPVRVAYAIHSEKEVGFTVSDYDRTLPLVIDPTLSWNTFLGGAQDDRGYAMAVDSSGNVYVAGTGTGTWGSPLEYYEGGGDAFAAKLTGSGSLTWNTFLGGYNGDAGRAIAVDASGNVYVTGSSAGTWGSPVHPHTEGWGIDAFAAKLASDGSLTWNTFLGGNSDDNGYAIAVDASGYVYVAGDSNGTWGSPVRVYTAKSDAYVAKLMEEPTLAKILSFRATGKEDRVALFWETESESDNAGFHLWRSDRQADRSSGSRERITGSLIPSRGTAVSGATYTYDDFDVLLGRGYFYELQDIDTSGKSSFHGPVSAAPGEITLLAPADGTTIPAGTPATFSWHSAPFDRFKLKLSKRANFRGALVLPIIKKAASKQSQWIKEPSYTPSRAEWNRIERMCGKRGLIHWRVCGKDRSGNAMTSEASRLQIR